MKKLIELWNKKNDKVINLIYYPEWEKNHFYIGTNGAKRNTTDCCFDFNINFFKIHFSYTNYNFNHKYRSKIDKENK